MKWSEIHHLADEMVDQQKKHLLKIGRQVIPYLTPDDILQPNDFPELESDPVFRYEEGLLAGLQSMRMALFALEKEEAEKCT